MTGRTRIALLAAAALLALGEQAHASSFATTLISYVPGGDGLSTGFQNPSTALGEPTRSNGTGLFDGDVTPFNSPFQTSDIVSLGLGGELVVAFDAPVEDDPLNPFGVDLLVFGNAFMGLDFGSLLATGTIFSEPGVIGVSQNGSDWVDIVGVFADDLFATLGYNDSPGPFDSGGSDPTDFTRSVDPSIQVGDFAGLTFAEVVAIYDGSGGGVPVDLAGTGLAWIQYVRVRDPFDDGVGPEIDAFADVTPIPEPTSLPLLMAALAATAALRQLQRIE
jgi:hypothetical protein